MMNNEEQRSVETYTYEQALMELERSVQQLEAGQLPLEEAIAVYKKAAQLSAHCAQKLQEAEQKIEVLLEQNGQWVKKPFVLQDT